MDTEQLLKSNGWDIICESPFEIQHKDGSFATGQAADLVLLVLRDLDEEKKGEKLLAKELLKLMSENIRFEKVREPGKENTWVEKLVMFFGEEKITEVVWRTTYS